MAPVNLAFLLLAPLLLFSVQDAVLLDGDQTTSKEVLQLLVHLQSEVSTLSQKVSAMENTDCGCHGTTPHTVPAFMASLNTDMHGCADGQTIVFETTRLNVGNGYDSRHGTFRAPVNGTYFFSGTLSARPNENFYVELVKNSPSNAIGYIFAEGETTHYQESGTSVVVNLNAGDDVWIVCAFGSSSILHGGQTGATQYHSHFSGFLVSQ